MLRKLWREIFRWCPNCEKRLSRFDRGWCYPCASAYSAGYQDGQKHLDHFPYLPPGPLVPLRYRT